MDRHRFDVDPDPTFHFDANADPDPTPSFRHVGKKYDFLDYSHISIFLVCVKRCHHFFKFLIVWIVLSRESGEEKPGAPT